MHDVSIGEGRRGREGEESTRAKDMKKTCISFPLAQLTLGPEKMG